MKPLKPGCRAVIINAVRGGEENLGREVEVISRSTDQTIAAAFPKHELWDIQVPSDSAPLKAVNSVTGWWTYNRRVFAGAHQLMRIDDDEGNLDHKADDVLPLSEPQKTILTEAK